MGGLLSKFELIRTVSGPSRRVTDRGRVDGVEAAASADGARRRRDGLAAAARDVLMSTRAARAPRATTVSTTQGQLKMGRPLLFQRPGRSVPVQGDDQEPAVGHLPGHPHLRDLPREPIARVGRRRQNL